MQSATFPIKTNQALHYILHRIKELWPDRIGYTDDGYTVTDTSRLNEQTLIIFESPNDLAKYLDGKFNSKIYVVVCTDYVEVAGCELAIAFLNRLPIWYKHV